MRPAIAGCTAFSKTELLDAGAVARIGGRWSSRMIPTPQDQGSLVLEQPQGREVALALPAGTAIQPGEQHVHLDEVGNGCGARACSDQGC
jgi:hypothetical protein